MLVEGGEWAGATTEGTESTEWGWEGDVEGGRCGVETFNSELGT
jgi:hypothetical protein